MTKIAGSGSISQRHGSADPDPVPDPHQNVMDPQHCPKVLRTSKESTKSITCRAPGPETRGRADVSYTWRRWVVRYCRYPRRLSGGPAGSRYGARHRRSAAPASNMTLFINVTGYGMSVGPKDGFEAGTSYGRAKMKKKDNKITFVFSFFPQYTMKKMFKYQVLIKRAVYKRYDLFMSLRSNSA
jgi:hypothetical protein